MKISVIVPVLNEEKIIPLVRRGEPVIQEETSSEEDFVNTLISIIEDYEEDGYENIAVIFKGKKELNKFAHLIKERINIQNLDNEDILYKGGKVLIPAYLSKGLEFDGVIVLWSHTVGGDDEGKRRLLYNAVTRAKSWCKIFVQSSSILEAAPFKNI